MFASYPGGKVLENDWQIEFMLSVNKPDNLDVVYVWSGLHHSVVQVVIGK